MVTFNSNFYNYGAGSYGGRSSNYQAKNNNRQNSPSVSSYSPSSINASGCGYGYGTYGAYCRYGITLAYGSDGYNITDKSGTLNNLVQEYKELARQFYSIQKSMTGRRTTQQMMMEYERLEYLCSSTNQAIDDYIGTLGAKACEANDGKDITIVSGGNTYKYRCMHSGNKSIGNFKYYWQSADYFY